MPGARQGAAGSVDRAAGARTYTIPSTLRRDARQDRVPLRAPHYKLRDARSGLRARKDAARRRRSGIAAPTYCLLD